MNGLREVKDYALDNSFEVFATKVNLGSVEQTKKVYDALRESKEGYIQIEKISDNNGYLPKGGSRFGYTQAFAKDLPLYISEPDSWYHTSNITSIDWEEGVFTTLNSVYSFKFK